ncbi:MAG: TIGR01777 family oxidoreductase [Terracidiphilus sp.]
MHTIADASPRPLRPLRIVLPGGSGLLGQVLARHFQERGHHVTVLTRGPYTAPWQTVHWDGEHDGPWTDYMEGSDVCINLAGRGVNCRYHAENRQVIYNSRIQTTQLLGRVIAALANPPKVWMNASAIAIYKRVVDTHRVDLPLDETSVLEDSEQIRAVPWSSSRRFMARVVRDWEAAFFGSVTSRTRKVALRNAIVFSPAPGSAFAVLSNLVRLGLGGKQGNGRQFVSWIHQDDFARAVEFLIHRDDLDGPFNIAAPNPLPNREFMAALRWAWDVPNGLPAPSLAIHIGAFLLRTQSQLVLKSSRVLPGRLLDAGFHFQFPEWPVAAEDLVQQWRHRND